MASTTYLADGRYPAPAAHPLPPNITGTPTQAELDAYPRMFTWGELKEIIQTGQLEKLMRNKGLQAKYDTWMMGIKAQYGSTEKYLTLSRLPWAPPSPPQHPEPTYDLSTALDASPSPTPLALPQTTGPSGRSTPYIPTTPGSGASTPSSAGFVSLASLPQRLKNTAKANANGGASKLANGVSNLRLGESSGSTHNENGYAEEEEEEEEEDDDGAEYLRWDANGLDAEKYAVLPNDWPYNVPYGVKHFCVWSRVPIAHPKLVDYSPDAWSRIESEGLGGFTGVIPLVPHDSALSPPISPLSSAGPSSPTTGPSPNPTPTPPLTPSHARSPKNPGDIPPERWFFEDLKWSGGEVRKWAGVEYECAGGSEVGRMVRGLWDERGWECVWFVNPPRLQSVPGFSHFHVFARRKTPPEIDASEMIWGTGPKPVRREV